MKARKPDRFEPIAKILQWLIVGTVVLVSVFYLWSSTRNAGIRYNNFAFVLEQKGILLDPFEANREGLIESLGSPYRIQSLRESETLMYWDFDPVTVQAHVFEEEVVRIGFFTDQPEIRADLIREIYQSSGGADQWRERSEADEVRKIDNAALERTIEASPSSVLVYGYLKKD